VTHEISSHVHVLYRPTIIAYRQTGREVAKHIRSIYSMCRPNGSELDIAACELAMNVVFVTTARGFSNGNPSLPRRPTIADAVSMLGAAGGLGS